MHNSRLHSAHAVAGHTCAVLCPVEQEQYQITRIVNSGKHSACAVVGYKEGTVADYRTHAVVPIAHRQYQNTSRKSSGNHSACAVAGYMRKMRSSRLYQTCAKAGYIKCTETIMVVHRQL